MLNIDNMKCCIISISISSLLIASHIKPRSFSNHAIERTNPKNSLCFNALHDKAFDVRTIIFKDIMENIFKHRIDLSQSKN
ncbi:MAG: putative restriction endonuclease [Clostridia bacterium]|nr:putative restriction endonuclease [Clostridia bacterium]